MWLWIDISVFSKVIFCLTTSRWNYLCILKVIFMKDLRFISLTVLIIYINKKQHLKHSDELSIGFRSSWLWWKSFHLFNTLMSVKNTASIWWLFGLWISLMKKFSFRFLTLSRVLTPVLKAFMIHQSNYFLIIMHEIL